MTRGSSSSGLTLIELLLGLLIFSLIAMSLYSTYINGVRVSQRVRLRDDLFREARWMIDALTLDLENMVAYRGPLVPGETVKGSFAGSEDHLSMILPTEDGLSQIKYYLRLPEYGSVFQTVVQRRSSLDEVTVDRQKESSRIVYLIREERPLRLPDGQEEPADDLERGAEILSRMVQEGSLRLAYADRGQTGELGISWRADWDEAYFPSGVRVELTLQPDSEDEPPRHIRKDILIPLGVWGKKEM
jgi:prepilin-type N-terminal cleavage/methylation domain-containing protein